MANKGKRHAELVRHIRDDGGAPVRDLGEPLMFPDKHVSADIDRRYKLKSPDEGEARRGLKKFQQSSEYKRFSPYRKRLY